MEKGFQKVPYQCTRHLKENANRHFLNHNVTEEIEKRNDSSIFSKTGRIYSDSRISYIERESEVLEISSTSFNVLKLETANSGLTTN
jgi:hypothetical protein